MRFNPLFLLTLSCILTLPAWAQATRSGSAVTPTDPRTGGEQDAQHPMQREMLKELEIKRGEGTHRQNVERAKEAAQIGAELQEAFARQKSQAALDPKKLSRLEKLARGIRSEAGGDDDKETMKDQPRDLQAALARLAELSDELRQKVEKTPRHVVSAAVISRANELIELIRHIRAFGL